MSKQDEKDQITRKRTDRKIAKLSNAFFSSEFADKLSNLRSITPEEWKKAEDEN